MPAEPIIEAEGLTRHYGERVAVDHIDFAISRGEVFGFLGPNGAGKSTTVRMLTGYIPPTSGTARVAGCDIVAEPVSARQHIGVVPEEASAYADLSVWQNIMLMGELHSVSRRRRTERGAELIELFGLADRRNQKGRDLSKGLRQRLMLCMALVSDPEILFLDEPTSGLDVASSHIIRDIVTRMNRERGMTVFITTHNIEEAGDLCHRVGIIDRGPAGRDRYAPGASRQHRRPALGRGPVRRPGGRDFRPDRHERRDRAVGGRLPHLYG